MIITPMRTAFAPRAGGAGGDLVTVVSGGREFVGWKRISMTREIGGAASAFALEMGREPVNGPRSVIERPLVPGVPVDIYIGDRLMLSGRAETVRPRRDPDEHVRQVQGRSHTGVLVKSSVAVEPLQYKSVTAPHLARLLAKPYGVEVVSPTDEGRLISTFDVKQGETVHAALERAARNRGMELTDDRYGRLVMLRPGAASAELPELRHLDGPNGAPDPENNVLASDGDFSIAARYGEIEVRSQSDPVPGQAIKSAAGVSASATDPTIGWPGKLVLVPDQQMTAAEARARAEYEVTRRAGRGIVYRPTVAGWRGDPGGPFWEINNLHRVRDVVQGLDQYLLVTAVTFTLDGAGGHRTALRLQPPEAFAANPDDLRDAKSQMPWDQLRGQFADG